MIRTKNSEAIKLLSPVIGNLMSSPDKIFPIKDGYWISKLIKTATAELETYQEKIKEVMEKYKGVVEEKDGMVTVTYPSVENAKLANAETDELGQIEIELPFKKVVAKNTWPDLTLAEITLLEIFTDFSQLGESDIDIPE